MIFRPIKRSQVNMKYPVNIQDKSSLRVYGEDGRWMDGLFRTSRPERVMVFPSEMVARVFARAHFSRPEQSASEVRAMLEGLDYPDARVD